MYDFFVGTTSHTPYCLLKIYINVESCFQCHTSMWPVSSEIVSFAKILLLLQCLYYRRFNIHTGDLSAKPTKSKISLIFIHMYDNCHLFNWFKITWNQKNHPCAKNKSRLCRFLNINRHYGGPLDSLLVNFTHWILEIIKFVFLEVPFK